jgi:hypothetical protein
MIKKREGDTIAMGSSFIILGALFLYGSTVASGYERTQIQIIGVLSMVAGSLIRRSLFLLLFSGISTILTYAGYPFIPAFLIGLPLLLFAALAAGSGSSGGGGSGGGIERKHYGEYGRYKGYSRQKGDRIEHHDEYGRHKGYSE